jgi:hypothetical protein
MKVQQLRSGQSRSWMVTPKAVFLVFTQFVASKCLASSPAFPPSVYSCMSACICLSVRLSIHPYHPYVYLSVHPTHSAIYPSTHSPLQQTVTGPV